MKFLLKHSRNCFYVTDIESIFIAVHNSQSEANLRLIEFQNLLHEIEFVMKQEFLRTSSEMRKYEEIKDLLIFLSCLTI